jgi:hypothetical protein
VIEERQTVAGAYREIRAHEELCAERYKGINEKLGWVLKGMAGLVLALLAWSVAQLYALEPLRMLATQQRAPTLAPAVMPTPPVPAANP